MKKYLFVLVVTTIFLTACGPTQIVLQNPETKEIVQCKGDPLANWSPAGAAKECAKGYEKAGYIRLSEY